MEPEVTPGVILSKLLQWTTKGVREYEEVDAKIIRASFEKAVETAYKAVMKQGRYNSYCCEGAAMKAGELAREQRIFKAFWRILSTMQSMYCHRLLRCFLF